MLVSGPIATSRSSPGADLAASTSLRGAKPAGQRRLMLGQRQPGLQDALCQLGWSPAASSAGQTDTERVMHTHACVDPDRPGQQLVRPDADYLGRRRRGFYAAKSARASNSSGQMHEPGQAFVCGS